MQWKFTRKILLLKCFESRKNLNVFVWETSSGIDMWQGRRKAIEVFRFELLLMATEIYRIVGSVNLRKTEISFDISININQYFQSQVALGYKYKPTTLACCVIVVHLLHTYGRTDTRTHMHSTQ